jgi:hypothetical protein
LLELFSRTVLVDEDIAPRKTDDAVLQINKKVVSLCKGTPAYNSRQSQPPPPLALGFNAVVFLFSLHLSALGVDILDLKLEGLRC